MFEDLEAFRNGKKSGDGGKSRRRLETEIVIRGRGLSHDIMIMSMTMIHDIMMI